MGDVAGSLLFPQPLHYSLAPPSSLRYYSSQYALCFVKNAVTNRKNRPTMASLCQDDRSDDMFSHRRAFLFVGLSVLPFLRLRARAIENLTRTESGLKTTEDNQKAEVRIYREQQAVFGSSSNPILSLLFVFVVGTVLGALYALVQKEKKTSNETIEYMTKKKLKEKETSFVPLEKDFEPKLQKQEEELRKAKEEEQNLINQLNSARGVITGLGQELKNEKRIIEELKVQLESSQGKLAEAGDFIGVLEDKLKLLAVELNGKEDTAFDYESQLRSQQIQSQSLKIAIIGFGNFGQFLAKTFVWRGHTILAHSRSDYSAIASDLGVRFFRDLHDLCEQHPDVVLLSTSILSTERVLREIPFQILKPNTLFVDVLSVKEVARDWLIKYLPNEFDILCTHPLFGPQSGKDSWAGLSFAYDKVRIGNAEGRMSRCDRFLDIFANEGCRMVEMRCAEHDKHAAASQFVTHTMGRVLEKFGLESSPINTKGYETLLDLVENTAGDSLDLYYGLFKYNNKNSMEQLERLHMAFEAVKRDLHRVYMEQLFGSGLEGLCRRGLLCKSCFTMVFLSLWNFVKKK